jgi:ethanolaminephosphotransferase
MLIESYSNVLVQRRKSGKPLLTPLLGYLPYLFHSAILVFWLQSELRGGVQLVHDARLLPFLGYWAMA